MTEITQIVSTVGFPIACVIFMGWFYYKVLNDMNTTLVLLRESVEELRKSVDKLMNEGVDEDAKNKGDGDR